MSSAMIEALDQAMRDTRGRIETTVGRLSDSYGLTVSEVAIALQYMQSRRHICPDGSLCLMYDMRIPVCPNSAHRDQLIALQMGGWFFDEVKWTRKRISISQRGRAPIDVDGWLSPSGRWHVRRARRDSDMWIVSHVPTGLAGMHPVGLLRDIKQALDDADAAIGIVTSCENNRDSARDLLAPYCEDITQRFAP